MIHFQDFELEQMMEIRDNDGDCHVEPYEKEYEESELFVCSFWSIYGLAIDNDEIRAKAAGELKGYEADPRQYREHIMDIPIEAEDYANKVYNHLRYTLAAPDLLEALEHALARLNEIPHTYSNTNFAQIERAIATAKGK